MLSALDLGATNNNALLSRWYPKLVQENMLNSLWAYPQSEIQMQTVIDINMLWSSGDTPSLIAPSTLSCLSV